MRKARVKLLLGDPDIPTHWVKVMADVPGDPPPPIHPGTKEPLASVPGAPTLT